MINSRWSRSRDVLWFPKEHIWVGVLVRPQWDALMARWEAELSDRVLVYDLTRFSRKILEGEQLAEPASDGVRCGRRPASTNLTTADGRRHFREAMVAAAGESDKISERVKRGTLRRARKGQPARRSPPVRRAGHVADPARVEPGDPRERAPQGRVAAGE